MKEISFVSKLLWKKFPFFLGADYLAYPPVVAYGDNANTIHYIKNSANFGDRKEVRICLSI